EQNADLGHDARELHLVVEDPSRVEAPGEDLDLLRDAPTGGVDQVQERQAKARGLLLDAHDLLHGLLAPRAGLHRVVVGHAAGGAAADPPDARDDAVGRRVGLLGSREQPVLLELGAGIEEELQAIPDEQLALLPELLAVLRVALLDSSPLLEVPLLTLAHGRLPSRVGPDDEDQDPIAVARAAEDHGVAVLSLEVGVELGDVAARETDLKLHGVFRYRLGRDLEHAVARYGPALRRADRHLRAIALERRVVLVREGSAELRQEIVETLVGSRRRQTHPRRRRRVAGEDDAGSEAHDLLRRSGGRREEHQEAEDHTEQRTQRRTQALARVVE